MQPFPIKAFMVVDAKGIPHHKIGESGIYLGEKTAQKKRDWFQARYASQSPFNHIQVKVEPWNP